MIIILIAFAIDVFLYQKVIDKGSLIADEYCININPIIIDRKSAYIKSMQVIIASGSAQEYQSANKKYLDLSEKFVPKIDSWLNKEKDFQSSWDYKLLTTSQLKNYANAQFDARLSEKNQSLLINKLSDNKNLQNRDALLNEFSIEFQKGETAYNELDKLWTEKRKFDPRNFFTKVPESKCPPENNYIPDVKDLMKPKISPDLKGPSA